MESPSKPKPPNADDKAQLKQRIANDADGIVDYIFPFHYPIKLLGDIMAAIFHFVSPYTPNLIPLAVFLLALPVIAFLSISAGWLVWRSVAIAWEAELPLQFGDGPTPYAEVALSHIVAKQPYDISLHLVVPAIEPNFALGNFMTTLTLVTPTNRTLAYVRKPSIVLPRSSAPWSFIFNWPGTVDLNIPLLTSYTLETSRALARVELGRRDQWRSLGNGEGRELSVLSAVLRGVVVHKGIRGLVSRFPLISSLIAAGTFLFISFVVLASCLLPALELRFNSDPHLHDPPPRPRRRPRKRPSNSALDTDADRARRPRPRKASLGREERRTPVSDRPSKRESQVELDPLDPELQLQPGPYADYREGPLKRESEETYFHHPSTPSLMNEPGIWDSTPSTPLRRRSRGSSSNPDRDTDG